MITSKEIIAKSIEQSEGKIKPRLGQIYSMLDKLVAEELIEKEVDNGTYLITKKGLNVINDIESARNTLQKQIDIISRMGNAVKLMVIGFINRLTTAGSTIISQLNYYARVISGFIE